LINHVHKWSDLISGLIRFRSITEGQTAQ